MPSPYKKLKVPPHEIKHAHATRLHPSEKRIAEQFGFPRMKDMIHFTIGDWFSHAEQTPDRFQDALAIQAAREMQVIVWRTIFPAGGGGFLQHKRESRWVRHVDPSIYDPSVSMHKLEVDMFRNVDRYFEAYGDPNRSAIAAIHELGLEAWHWADMLFDNGAPCHILYHGDTSFHFQSFLQEKNPGICRVDRFGHPHYGVWEYRYPDARQWTVKRFLDEFSTYDFDGLFITTRSHSVPALDGEQYGYNDVIEDELKKRTGISFRDPAYWRRPDVQEARRRIVGESVTLLLRDLRAAWPKGKKLCIGIPRTEYWGPPYGNVFIDWRTWLRERLVDGLMLGEISGKALYYPALTDGEYRNYLADEEAGIGLRPYFYDLEHVYGPACQAVGAELFTSIYNKSVQRETFGGECAPKLEFGLQPN